MGASTRTVGDPSLRSLVSGTVVGKTAEPSSPGFHPPGVTDHRAARPHPTPRGGEDDASTQLAPVAAVGLPVRARVPAMPGPPVRTAGAGDVVITILGTSDDDDPLRDTCLWCERDIAWDGFVWRHVETGSAWCPDGSFATRLTGGPSAEQPVHHHTDQRPGEEHQPVRHGTAHGGTHAGDGEQVDGFHLPGRRGGVHTGPGCHRRPGAACWSPSRRPYRRCGCRAPTPRGPPGGPPRPAPRTVHCPCRAGSPARA